MSRTTPTDHEETPLAALIENLHPLLAGFELPADASPADRRFVLVQNALLRGVEARGYRVESRYGGFERMWVEIGGERVDWRLRERDCVRNVPLTKRELKRATDGKTTWQELVPSGYLVLSAKADYSSDKHTYEKRKRPFDRRIDEFLAQFEALAAHAASRRQESADWERRRVEKLERWENKQRQAAFDERRWDRLRGMALQYAEIDRLRAFVEAVGSRLETLDDRPAYADDWLDWARARIAALDPALCDPRTVYETMVLKPRNRPRPRSDYEREFGEPDPDIEEDW